MTDHYIEHMQDQIRQLKLERDLLHAKVASLEAKAPTDAQVHLLLSRITELTAEKEAAEAEVERLTGLLEAADNVVAAQDRRIAEALARCEETAGDHPDRDIAADYSPLLARDIIEALRGESDE